MIGTHLGLYEILAAMVKEARDSRLNRIGFA